MLVAPPPPTASALPRTRLRPHSDQAENTRPCKVLRPPPAPSHDLNPTSSFITPTPAARQPGDPPGTDHLPPPDVHPLPEVHWSPRPTLTVYLIPTVLRSNCCKTLQGKVFLVCRQCLIASSNRLGNNLTFSFPLPSDSR